MQQIFAQCIVKPSAKLGLLGDTKNLNIAGDVTRVKSDSSSHGKKVRDCKKNTIYNCKCNRKFSDPNWDSCTDTWVILFVATGKSKKLDLPIYQRFLEARRHDSVSTVVALAELPKLYSEFGFGSFACDCAADDYVTYELFR